MIYWTIYSMWYNSLKNKYLNSLKGGKITVKKHFKLDENYLQTHRKQVKKAIYDLNNFFDGKVNFKINGTKLDVLILEEKFKSNAGRPLGHEFDFETVKKMKADGKSNKEIYTALGISKSLYYLRMKEYKE